MVFGRKKDRWESRGLGIKVKSTSDRGKGGSGLGERGTRRPILLIGEIEARMGRNMKASKGGKA